jgi:hypothetical protein
MDQALRTLLKTYSLVGIAHWNKDADDTTKEIARAALKNQIAEREYEAGAVIDSKLKRGGDPRALFIPMPMVNHSGILHCFFLPIPDAEQVSFDLVLIVKDGRSLGFRFEPPDEGESTHGYGHVQMNRTMFRETIPVKGIPNWVPDGYPAFPQRASEPLHLFLSMATSIHGYEKGMKRILFELFETDPIRRKKYLDALDATVM